MGSTRIEGMILPTTDFFVHDTCICHSVRGFARLRESWVWAWAMRLRFVGKARSSYEIANGSLIVRYKKKRHKTPVLPDPFIWAQCQ